MNPGAGQPYRQTGSANIKKRDTMKEKKELKVNLSLLQYTYRKLLEFLQENRNFTREGLNRVTLSEILDSNEKYLCLAVKKFSKEKTLKKLIEGMRMKYAASLLLEYMNRPVDEIARMCGIKSRCTFYRAFHRQYHCTPAEYRQQYYPLDEMNEPEKTEEPSPTDKNLKTEPTLIGIGLSTLKQL